MDFDLTPSRGVNLLGYIICVAWALTLTIHAFGGTLITSQMCYQAIEKKSCDQVGRGELEELLWLSDQINGGSCPRPVGNISHLADLSNRINGSYFQTANRIVMQRAIDRQLQKDQCVEALIKAVGENKEYKIGFAQQNLFQWIHLKKAQLIRKQCEQKFEALGLSNDAQVGTKGLKQAWSDVYLNTEDLKGLNRGVPVWKRLNMFKSEDEMKKYFSICTSPGTVEALKNAELGFAFAMSGLGDVDAAGIFEANRDQIVDPSNRRPLTDDQILNLDLSDMRLVVDWNNKTLIDAVGADFQNRYTNTVRRGEEIAVLKQVRANPAIYDNLSKAVPFAVGLEGTSRSIGFATAPAVSRLFNGHKTVPDEILHRMFMEGSINEALVDLGQAQWNSEFSDVIKQKAISVCLRSNYIPNPLCEFTETLATSMVAGGALAKVFKVGQLFYDGLKVHESVVFGLGMTAESLRQEFQHTVQTCRAVNRPQVLRADRTPDTIIETKKIYKYLGFDIQRYALDAQDDEKVKKACSSEARDYVIKRTNQSDCATAASMLVLNGAIGARLSFGF
jgi:hypothetical protein